jgi:hypothetical protein
MSNRRIVQAAARNNAEWCDTFCRTHEVVGRFRADSWFSPVRTPPTYPDAVTLGPGTTAQDVMRSIETGEGCSVKDSFAVLNLAVAGFRPLFRAAWLLRDSDGALSASGRGWSALTTDDQLAEWEAAWAELPEGSGFFRPALLADETIGVLAKYDGDRIVAGAVAKQSAGVIGLSNLFAAHGDLESALVGAAAAAAARWGDLPTVGYESGAWLDAGQAAGFTPIGDLVVWLYGPPSPA